MSEDYAVKSENNEVVGWIMFESGEGYAFWCSTDGHEEWGYATAEKAEDALFEYYYQDEEVNLLCSYADWAIFERNGKQYFMDEDGDTREATEVCRLNITTETEAELFDGAFVPVAFDVCGELDSERGVYCYWRVA